MGTHSISMANICTAHNGNGGKRLGRKERGRQKKGRKLLLYSHSLICIPTHFIHPSTHLVPWLSACTSVLTTSFTLVMFLVCH
ncbi:hypothetical protein GGI35DRAFT_320601 [Trichoderma velutinum]